MICQQVTLSGYAEWPKVADAVIEARCSLSMRMRQRPYMVWDTVILLYCDKLERSQYKAQRHGMALKDSTV
jgi:hypothetical protein